MIQEAKLYAGYMQIGRKPRQRMPQTVKNKVLGRRVSRDYATHPTDSAKTPYAKTFKTVQLFLRGSRTHFDVESSGLETKPCRGLKGGAWQGDLKEARQKNLRSAYTHGSTGFFKFLRQWFVIFHALLVRALPCRMRRSKAWPRRLDYSQAQWRFSSAHQNARSTNLFSSFFIDPKAPFASVIFFKQPSFFITINKEVNPCT